MCIIAGDHPWQHLLRDRLGVDDSLSEQPAQRYLGTLVALMVPDFTSQTRLLRQCSGLPQGFEALFDEGMLIKIGRRILRLMGQANEVQGPQAMAGGEQRTLDRLGAELLPHSGELHFHQLWLQPYGLQVQRHSLPDIHHLRQPRQREEIQGQLKTLRIPCLFQECSGPDEVVAV
jgi:hypothetical protein